MRFSIDEYDAIDIMKRSCRRFTKRDKKVDTMRQFQHVASFLLDDAIIYLSNASSIKNSLIKNRRQNYHARC